MPPQVVVAYATRTGSTAGIAEAVGRELESAGLAVTVAPMKDIRSLEGIDVVVIGAPIYMGKPVGVKKFVKNYQNALIDSPVAAFAVGMAPVNEDADAVREVMKRFHDALEPVRPVASIMFAGRLDPDRLSFIQRKIVEKVDAPTGDHRDWTAITEWARMLPGVLGV